MRLRAIGRAAVVLSALVMALSGSTASGQETQVALDTEGSVHTLDSARARELGLFSEVEGFLEARVFEDADGRASLEILARRAGRIVRERRALTPEDLEALRRRVSEAITARAAMPVLRNGRPALLIGSTALSLGYHCWSVPKSLDLEDREAVGIGMLSGAAGFFIPLFLTRHEDVTPAMSNLALYGGTRGILYGFLLHEAVQDSADFDDDPAYGRGSIASALFGTLGYFWARQTKMSIGTSNMIGVGGDAGLLWGLGVAELLDWNGVEAKEEERAALMLSSAAVGMAGGAVFARHRDLSWGDTEVIRTTGVLGAGIAATVVDLSDTEEKDPYVTAALLGSLAGAVAGDQLTRSTEFSTLEALLLDAGTAAGAALGLGIGYLADSGSASSEAYTVGSSVGAVGAFVLCYRLLSGEARARAERSR